MKFYFITILFIANNFVDSKIYLDSNVSQTEMDEQKIFNIKLLNQYLKLFNYYNDSENEDQMLQAYDHGDQDRTRFQKIMAKVPILRNSLGKTCFPDIGCFAGKEFQDEDRPLPLMPMGPQYINPMFLIFTRESRSDAYALAYNPSDSVLRNSPFNPEYKTIMIVHGYKSGLENWLLSMKDMILNQNENYYNVILVNWEKGSKVQLYFLAVSNTRVVGAQIAFFINSLVDYYNITNDRFHLIGHSLGAHVCGFAGKRLFSPTLSRITGLDPAGPGFRSTKLRLDPSDAAQVDVIHTDIAEHLIEGLGNDMPLGRVDFYPNGGKSQPGCPATTGVVNIIKTFAHNQDLSCSHGRSWHLAITSGKSKSKCLPVGYLCDDWETFLEGRCANCMNNSHCHLMGFYLSYWNNTIMTEFNSNSKTDNFYLNTNSAVEYCVFHYQIAFHLDINSDKWASGIIGITLYGTVNGKESKFFIRRIISEIDPKYVHTILVTFRYVVEKIDKAVLEWNDFKGSSKIKQRGKKLVIKFVEINYMSHIEDSVRKNYSVVLCPEKDNILVFNSGNIGFNVCNNTGPEYLARDLNYKKLKALTDRKDIVTVDYDRIDKIYHKIYKSNASD